MSRWVRNALGAVVVAALTGAAGLTWLALGDDPGGHVLTDLDGHRVALDAVPDTRAADVRPTGGRFQAPSQGLDVPLVEMSVAGGVLNPPTLTEAFVVRDPDGETAEGVRPRVVALHAVRDGRAPGNAFFEHAAADPAPTVRAGDELVLDGVRYTVEGTDVRTKAEAAQSADIWAPRPDGADRLVIITCLQRAGRTGAAAENLVVHAART
ncbi:hypothetical protein LEP48_17775 [Isoptericola sp. NEAU-Y5]|uniref:Class F sortase n=1 Tax=Isoptericola luteus TaxID=2879484 RepID=A0ABS7ZJH6_9MICO|nr:hypothetical protein [Isoptericola sp. NEAU-Y5]MCA5895181.1 hypothetical protein [Isoptericola sp. NEAU-Y5]